MKLLHWSFSILLGGILGTSSLAQTELKQQPTLSDTFYLQPVSIVALHTGAHDKESHHLDYVDQMAQDGGALLDGINAFSTIRKSGSYGLDPVFRGFKYEQLNIVLNGSQSALAACPNRMDPPTSQLTPNMIQRVEVIKGPHALRYGCAFGATINFIPTDLRFSEQRQVYGRLSGGWESNGNILRSEAMLGLSASRYDLGLFGSWSQGSDYHDGEGTAVPAEFLKGSGGMQLGLKLTAQQVLKLSATRNLARDVDFAALPMDLRSDDTWMLNTSHEIRFKNRKLRLWSSTLYGSFVDHLMDNYSKALDPRMVDAETRATTRNWGGRTEGSWSLSRARLYAGADFRMEGAGGTRYREFLMGPNAGKTMEDNVWQDGQIFRSGMFAEFHLRAAGIRWVLSGRMEVNRAMAGDPDPAFVQIQPETNVTQFNPGISLGGTKALGEHFSLGLWAGRSSRSGSLTERYMNFFPVGQDPYEMLGNPQIKAETNNQADLQLKWTSDATVISLDLFASYMQDYISSVIDTSLNPRLPGSPGVRRYTNLDRALLSGFELSWSQHLFLGLQHQFSLAYTYGQNLDLNEPLPEIAPMDFRYRLSGYFLKDRLKPWIRFRHVLEQARVSPEFGETQSPAFSLLDLGISYRILENIRISAGVNNLLDQAYYEHLSRSVRGPEVRPIYAPGRSFMLSFSLDFR